VPLVVNFKTLQIFKRLKFLVKICSTLDSNFVYFTFQVKLANRFAICPLMSSFLWKVLFILVCFVQVYLRWKFVLAIHKWAPFDVACYGMKNSAHHKLFCMNYLREGPYKTDQITICLSLVYSYVENVQLGYQWCYKNCYKYRVLISSYSSNSVTVVWKESE